MKPTLYPIQAIGRGTLSAMPMPSADCLEKELKFIHKQKVSKILCLMQTDESISLGLQAQESICTKLGIEFQRFAIPDYGVPDLTDLKMLTRQLHTEIIQGTNLLVHCRGGIGRTGLVCCCLLIATGLSASEAVAIITEKRGCSVPETPAQCDLIRQFEQDTKLDQKTDNPTY